ncbi:hypothetical protein LTR17_010380 [Elasticomyces elasticus]|nr:hypothetical protein LTR17_010380 [Elasticomyces elasticus]
MSDSSSKNPTKQVCGVCGSTNASSGSQLLKCGRCRCVSYCSKDCQRKDWKLHKVLCKIPPATHHHCSAASAHYEDLPSDIDEYKATFPAWQLTMSHRPQGSSKIFYEFVGTVLHSSGSKSTAFMDLPATTAIGFPLRMAKFPGGLSQPNVLVRALDIDVDPHSLTYGSPRTDRTPMGNVIIERQDGKHIKCLHIQAVIYYLQDGFDKLCKLARRMKNGERVDLRESVAEMLTPSSFARGFEEIKADAIAQGNMEWVGLEAPVQADLVIGTQ